MQDLQHLKYPIGEYQPPLQITPSEIETWIRCLQDFPEQLIALVNDFSNEDLEKPYRPNGWTARQVIHHLADSHINAYTRFHLTLTEENPTIRPYDEVKWAELYDAKNSDIQLSVNILTAIHQRLVTLLKTLNYSDFDRTYVHPGTGKQYTMGYLLGNYAWHGLHHLEHLKICKA